MSKFTRLALMYLLAALLLIISNKSFAQDPTSESQLKQEAAKYFDLEDYASAYPLYSQLLSLYPDDPTYNYRTGACMLFTKADKEKPIDYLELAIKKPKIDNIAYFYLGRAYHLNYKFDAAIRTYQRFQKMASSSELKKYPVAHLIDQCNDAKTLLKNMHELDVLDKKELNYADYFQAYDLSANGGSVLVEPDDFKTKLDKKKDATSIIYLSADKNKVFFSSYGDDDKNGKDIYEVKRLPTGGFSKPVNLGTIINSPYDEDFPFYDEPTKTLYFSSKGHNSMGGYDVFKSSYNEITDTWSSPVNMDFPINTPDDDILFIADTLNQTAFFASTRFSPKGSIDVYKIKLQPHAPEYVLMRGTTYGDDGKNIAVSTITVKNFKNDQVVGVYNSSPDNGSYLMSLPNAGKFVYTVETNGHKTQSEPVIIPLETGMITLRQKITYEPETDKLIINNDFESAGSDSDYLLALNYIKQKAQMEVHIDSNANNPPANNTSVPLANNANSTQNSNSTNPNASNNSTEANSTNTNSTQPNNSSNTNSNPANSNNSSTNNSTNSTANNTTNPNNTSVTANNNNPDSSNTSNGNVSTAELVKIASNDAKQDQEMAKSMKEDASKATEYANDKLQQAQELQQQAQEITDNSNNITDPAQKKDSLAKADALRQQSQELSKKAIEAYELAAQEQNQARDKQQQADQASNYSSQLDSAQKVSNKKQALAQLQAQHDKLLQQQQQKQTTEPIATTPTELILQQAEATKQDSTEVAHHTEDLKKEVPALQQQSQDYIAQAQKTENPQEKLALLQQAKDLSDSKKQKEKEIKQSAKLEQQLHNQYVGQVAEAHSADSISKAAPQEVTSPQVAANDVDLKKEIANYNPQANNNNTASNNNSTVANNTTTNPTNNSTENTANNTSTNNSTQPNNNSTVANNTATNPTNNSTENSANNSSTNNTTQPNNNSTVANNTATNPTNNSTENPANNTSTNNSTQPNNNSTAANNSTTNPTNNSTENSANNTSTNNTTQPNNNSTAANNSTTNPTNNSTENPANNTSTNNSTQPNNNSTVANNSTTNPTNNSTENSANNTSTNNTTQPNNNSTAANNSTTNPTNNSTENSVNNTSTNNTTQPNNNSTAANNTTTNTTNNSTENPANNNSTNNSTQLNNNATTTNNQSSIQPPANNQQNVSQTSSLYSTAPTMQSNTTAGVNTVIPTTTVQYSNPAASEANKSAAAFSTNAESATGQANATRMQARQTSDPQQAKLLYQKADSLDNVATQEKLQGTEYTNNANVTQYESNQQQLASWQNTLQRNSSDKITTANLLVQDANFYYNKSITEKHKADSNKKSYIKESYLENAKQDIATALLKQQQAENIYLSVDPNVASEAASNIIAASNTQNTPPIYNNTTTTENNTQVAQNTNPANTTNNSTTPTNQSNSAQNNQVNNSSNTNNTTTLNSSTNNPSNSSTTNPVDNSTNTVNNTQTTQNNPANNTSNNTSTQSANKIDSMLSSSNNSATTNTTNNSNNPANSSNSTTLNNSTNNSTENPANNNSTTTQNNPTNNTTGNPSNNNTSNNSTVANNSTTNPTNNSTENPANNTSTNNSTQLNNNSTAANNSTTNPTNNSTENPANNNSANNSTQPNNNSSTTNNTSTQNNPTNNSTENPANNTSTNNSTQPNNNSTVANNTTTNPTENPANNNSANNSAQVNSNSTQTNQASNTTASIQSANKIDSMLSSNNSSTNNSSGTNNPPNNANTANNNTQNNNSSVSSNNTSNPSNTQFSEANNIASNNSATTNNTTAAEDVFVESSTSPYSETKPIPVDPPLPQGLIYKVQIGAFRNPIPQNLFKGINPIAGEKTRTGLTRYLAGIFKEYGGAKSAENKIHQLGYKDAFIVAFLNGKRISLAQANGTQGSNTPNNTIATNTTQPENNNTQANTNTTQTQVQPSDLTNSAPVAPIKDLKGLFYTVQVGAFQRPVSSASLYNLNPLFSYNAPNGYIRYNCGIYSNLPQANIAKQEIILKTPIKDAFIVVYSNGERIGLGQASQLLNSGAATISTSPLLNVMPNGAKATSNNTSPQVSPSPNTNSGNTPPSNTNTVAPPALIDTSKPVTSNVTPPATQNNSNTLTAPTNPTPPATAGWSMTSRSLSSANIDPAGDITVSVTIHRGSITGFAKLEEEIPAGFTATEGEKQNATFKFENAKASYLWLSLPSDSIFTVSYKLSALSTAAGQQTITGKFLYTSNDERQEAPIAPSTITVGGSAITNPATSVIPENANNSTPNTPSVPDTYMNGKVSFCVQVGAYSGNIPVDMANKLLQISNQGIHAHKEDNGITSYTVGDYATYTSADLLKQELVKAGDTESFIVAYYQGKKISLQQAQALINK